jgi:hypothetical protein
VRIGLDVDGTVYNWESQFRFMLRQLYGLHIPLSANWDSIKNACTDQQWSSVWDNAADELFTGGQYYDGAREMVADLTGTGHEVVFITATPVKVRAHRGCKLFLDFPGICGVVFVSTGDDDKSLVKCDLYVDDKPEVIAELMRQGHKSLLVPRPWNDHVTGATSIADWSQLKRIVEELT